MKRHLIIAVLATFCLTATLFMITSTRSTPGSEYDPWLDINDDGKIDLKDYFAVALSYGAVGKPINKTGLLLYLNETVAELQSRVETLESKVEVLENVSSGSIPIGAIIPWAKDLTGVPAIPDSFVECNGQTLNDLESPLHGQVVPNLNGENRFLRGNLASGTTGGSETHYHGISVAADGHYQGGDVKGHPGYTNAASSLPPYYSVVWIMRVK